MLVAQRPGEAFLLAVHHSNDLVAGGPPADPDLRMKYAPDLVNLVGVQEAPRCPMVRNQRAEPVRECLRNQVLSSEHESGPERLFKAWAEERGALEFFACEIRQEDSVAPPAAELISGTQARAPLEGIHRPERIVAHLADGIFDPQLTLRLAKLDPVGRGLRDAVEPPILDLQDDQPEVGPNNDEVGVTAIHGNVVIDEIVLGKVIAQGDEDLALARHDSPIARAKHLGDGERHGSILLCEPCDRTTACGS